MSPLAVVTVTTVSLLLVLVRILYPLHLSPKHPEGQCHQGPAHEGLGELPQWLDRRGGLCAERFSGLAVGGVGLATVARPAGWARVVQRVSTAGRDRDVVVQLLERATTIGAGVAVPRYQLLAGKAGNYGRNAKRLAAMAVFRFPADMRISP